ncbi:MAG: hypothetical protein JXO49_11990 [Deltaproteobacteria bacterium]|nr:hypothetical protein [Candidatus Anaeroferrophillus wilburensis]MBN2890054.1 hypothetical protein [Deltaproteobacteria bacterium]
MILPVGSLAEGLLYREVNLLAGYRHEEKVISTFNERMKNSIGMEYFHPFANDYGDFLTGDLQLRLSYDSTTERQDAWALEVHSAWLEYRPGLGKAFTVGHFTPPFGLETALDTHSTLHQTLASHAIGFKKDWGLAYRSFVGRYNWQTAVQLGSGMGLEHRHGSYLLSTRISTTVADAGRYGLSLMTGNTLTTEQFRTLPAPEWGVKSVEKKGIALDWEQTLGITILRGELHMGRRESATTAGVMTEWLTAIPDFQEITLKIQGFYWTDDWQKKAGRTLTLFPVAEYRLSNTTTIRLGYAHEFSSTAQEKDRLLLLQLYYYGQ